MLPGNHCRKLITVRYLLLLPWFHVDAVLTYWDAVLVVVDAAKATSGRPQKAEEYLFERLKECDIPATLILNKVGAGWVRLKWLSC
jgi:hypothetical protein